MNRTSVLLLQPTARQQRTLSRLLTAQRELYNAALEERVGAWRWERRSVAYYDQQRSLTGWKQEFGVSPARGTLLRLDRAFQAFFRRVSHGDTPGFPRFKADSRWDSVEYPTTHCWSLTSDRVGRLYLKGVGHIRFRTSRRGVPGKPKTLVVRREGTRWRAYVVCEIAKPEPRPATGRAVGVDLGVTQLLATRDGELVDNPRWFRRSGQRLAHAQRQLATRQRGSNRRRHAVLAVARVHRKIRNQRRDAHHKLSRRIVNDCDVIVHEDLRIANLTRSAHGTLDNPGNNVAAKAGLNREILSAGWGQLLRFIAYKAEEAGRTVIAVDPKHTSQTCHNCGHVDAGSRTGTVFRCRCGHRDHADINAAKNILRAGLAQRLSA